MSQIAGEFKRLKALCAVLGLGGLRPSRGGATTAGDLAAAADLHADPTGPTRAALGRLSHTAATPEARSLDAGGLQAALTRAGGVDLGIARVIPELTMLAGGANPDAGLCQARGLFARNRASLHGPPLARDVATAAGRDGG